MVGATSVPLGGGTAGAATFECLTGAAAVETAVESAESNNAMQALSSEPNDNPMGRGKCLRFITNCIVESRACI